MIRLVLQRVVRSIGLEVSNQPVSTRRCSSNKDSLGYSLFMLKWMFQKNIELKFQVKNIVMKIWNHFYATMSFKPILTVCFCSRVPWE